MSFELDDIYFLENYETLLIIENHIYLSNRKYFSMEHFKNDSCRDKNLIVIKTEEILKINFNDRSEHLTIETKLKSFELLFFSNKMMLGFVSRTLPFLTLEQTEKELSSLQKLLPALFIFLVITSTLLLFGIENNFIILISLPFGFAAYLIYKRYGNSKNISYTRP
ncbi:hypothetical protein [Flavobacterium sp. ACN6]|uniref:hypothetical protein n=1 Tax=Flavobacterium sp. ACN6 TaxID=1920426 RepID=UPI000BB2DE14|nr:hypothetical protein [Flavobacterium sp. ACN6]PBJ05621.1 hypothetical protein BSF42_42650 [Flavobacterium sp. ACN6]